MKFGQRLIGIFSILNFIGFVVFLGVMVVSIRKGAPLDWVVYLVSAIFCLLDGFVFLYLWDLGDRLETVEKKITILLPSEETPVGGDGEGDKLPNSHVEEVYTFNRGEPVKLSRDVDVDGKTFKKGRSGTIAEVKGDRDYLVEFYDEKGVFYPFGQEDLKSFFR